MTRITCAAIAAILILSAAPFERAVRAAEVEATLRGDTSVHVAAARRTAPLLRPGAWRSEEEEDLPPIATAAPEFGKVDMKYFEFGGFSGLTLEDLDEPGVAASLTVGRYIADGLALGARLDLLAFDLEDDVQSGASLGITFRWHLYEQARWTLFLDGGVGMMVTTGGVPAGGGSRFNFTPEMGVGASFDVGREWRVVAGLRWHHVSNAKSWRGNPGRDAAALFAGITVPF